MLRQAAGEQNAPPRPPPSAPAACIGVWPQARRRRPSGGRECRRAPARQTARGAAARRPPPPPPRRAAAAGPQRHRMRAVRGLWEAESLSAAQRPASRGDAAQTARSRGPACRGRAGQHAERGALGARHGAGTTGNAHWGLQSGGTDSHGRDDVTKGGERRWRDGCIGDGVGSARVGVATTCCATASESAGCVVHNITAAAAASGRRCLESESRKERIASSAYLKASAAPWASSPQCWEAQGG